MSSEIRGPEKGILMIALGVPVLLIGLFLLSQDSESLGSLSYRSESITALGVMMILAGVGYLAGKR